MILYSLGILTVINLTQLMFSLERLATYFHHCQERNMRAHSYPHTLSIAVEKQVVVSFI
jgi:hypothetical protein